jgi:hypothetical protein
MATSPTSKKPFRLYPSHLELYEQCPRKFVLKVVERRRVEEAFSPALAKGKIAHEVLKICTAELRDNAAVPADLRALVAPRLPREEYDSPLSWESDVAEVVEWVKYGLSYIDPTATILGVEKFLDRSFKLDGCGDQPIPLGAVIDLVLLRTDANGDRYVEIVDYKTGKNLDQSRFAPVIARFVLKSMLAAYFPDTKFAPVVYTELYLAKQVPRSRDLNLDDCLKEWEEVTRVVADIQAEEAWEPSPSPLCQWCPFNGNGCWAENTGDDGSLW